MATIKVATEWEPIGRVLLPVDLKVYRCEDCGSNVPCYLVTQEFADKPIYCTTYNQRAEWVPNE